MEDVLTAALFLFLILLFGYKIYQAVKRGYFLLPKGKFDPPSVLISREKNPKRFYFVLFGYLVLVALFTLPILMFLWAI